MSEEEPQVEVFDEKLIEFMEFARKRSEETRRTILNQIQVYQGRLETFYGAMDMPHSEDGILEREIGKLMDILAKLNKDLTTISEQLTKLKATQMNNDTKEKMMGILADGEKRLTGAVDITKLLGGKNE